jgi:ankyrin repeat protein
VSTDEAQAPLDSAPGATGPVPDQETLAFAAQLFDLAREGDASQLAAYLDAGVPADLTNDKGDTLLLLAAYHRQADAVRVLLARGADVARVNDRGQTALAAAVFRSDAEIVRLLLDAGASPSDGGPSALETARFFDLPEMVALLQRG